MGLILETPFYKSLWIIIEIVTKFLILENVVMDILLWVQSV